MLKHLPHSGMDFLHHIFNLSWSWHSFSSIWKIFSIISINKMGMALDSLSFFLLAISLTSCVSKLYERIILLRWFFDLKSLLDSLSPPGRFPPWMVHSPSNFLSFCVHFGWFYQTWALGRLSLWWTFPRLSTLSGIPLFSTNLFRLATILVVLVGLNLYFSDRREYVVFKITEVAAFKSAEEFRK